MHDDKTASEAGQGGRWRHSPARYDCPFCADLHERRSPYPLEIIHEDTDTFVKVNPRWWTPAGGLLAMPKVHVENLYELPDDLAVPMQRTLRQCALSLKAALRCGGVSTRQHNEPAGGQDVWHYHVHVFPRWHGDDLYLADPWWATSEEIGALAAALREHWVTD